MLLRGLLPGLQGEADYDLKRRPAVIALILRTGLYPVRLDRWAFRAKVTWAWQYRVESYRNSVIGYYSNDRRSARSKCFQS